MSRGRPLLGVALDEAGALLLEPDGATRLAAIAERGGVDFVTLDDNFDPRGGARDGADALLVFARVAAATSAIGLIPTVTTTHTEPFHISKNIATLDLVSGGRAGWMVAVSRSDTAARRFGRAQPRPPDELWAEAEDAIEVVSRLWDSWEDDAVIRDRATGRYLDRDKVHYVDFEGRFFRVRGPSITPRPPQGQPIVAVRIEDEHSRRVAVERADLIVVDQPDPGLRDSIVAAGRDPTQVCVVSRLMVSRGDPAAIAASLATTDADGVLLVPSSLPDVLELVVDEVVPLLRRDALAAAAAERTTLRDRLGLVRPANRYSTTGATS